MKKYEIKSRKTKFVNMVTYLIVIIFILSLFTTFIVSFIK